VDAGAGLTAPERLCCDQQVIYAPQIDRFIWVRQTETNGEGENRYSISVASPKTIAAGGAWQSFDLTPSTFLIGGKRWWFDYDLVSVGTQSFFISFNVEGSGRSIVARVPLRSLTKQAAFSISWYFPAQGANFRVAQNLGTRAYFAYHKDGSTLGVCYWDDGSLFVYCGGVPVSSLSESYSSVQPDGVDWLDRYSKISGRVQGGTRAGSQLWFAWTGGIDKTFKQPHIEIAVINIPALTLAQERYIYNDTFAFAYPDLASNSAGDVAIAYSWGGPAYNSRTGVGFLTGRQDLINTSDPGEGSGGHFITLHRDWPQTRLFTVSNYWQPFTDNTRTVRVNHAQFMVFGRLGDAPSGGLPRPQLRGDLIVTEVRKDSYTIMNRGVFATDRFEVSIENDSRQFTATNTVSGLAPGASLTQTFQCQPSGTIVVTADINNDVEETNEDNNTASGSGNTCVF
jgi:hypothetical protein